MKTLKLIPLFLIFILLNGCCDNCETKLKTCNDNQAVLENKITLLQDKIPELNRLIVKTTIVTDSKVFIDEKFCESTESVYKRKYDTNTGKANLEIRTPEGHRLIFIGSESNDLYFLSVGNTYGNKVIKHNVTVNDLSRTRNSISNVYLRIRYNDNQNTCGNDIDILGEKHKGSVVNGVPIHGNEIEN